MWMNFTRIREELRKWYRKQEQSSKVVTCFDVSAHANDLLCAANEVKRIEVCPYVMFEREARVSSYHFLLVSKRVFTKHKNNTCITQFMSS